MQETDRHDLRYDVVVVGGGSAGLSAALVLGRLRRRTLVLAAGEPRNAPSSGVHGFFSRDGIRPEELLKIGREQLEPYPSVEVRFSRATGTSGENGDFEVTLDDGAAVRAHKLLLATGVVDELPEKPGFKELWGRGVYHCPYCHGWEVRDRQSARGPQPGRGGGLTRGLHPQLDPPPGTPDRRAREPQRRRTTDAPRPRHTGEGREDLAPVRRPGRSGRRLEAHPLRGRFLVGARGPLLRATTAPGLRIGQDPRLRDRGDGPRGGQSEERSYDEGDDRGGGVRRRRRGQRRTERATRFGLRGQRGVLHKPLSRHGRGCRSGRRVDIGARFAAERIYPALRRR